jgi:hypothetical protein
MAERDIERERRLAIESDFDRVSKLLEIYPEAHESLQRQFKQGSALLEQQLERIASRYEELGKVPKPNELSVSDKALFKVVLRLLFDAMHLETSNHNLLMGQRVGRELMRLRGGAAFPAEQTFEHSAVIAGGFLLACGDMLKGNSQTLLDAARAIVTHTSLGEDALQIAGEGLIKNQPELVERIRHARSFGSPTPVADMFLPPITKE